MLFLTKIFLPEDNWFKQPASLQREVGPKPSPDLFHLLYHDPSQGGKQGERERI